MSIGGVCSQIHQNWLYKSIKIEGSKGSQYKADDRTPEMKRKNKKTHEMIISCKGVHAYNKPLSYNECYSNKWNRWEIERKQLKSEETNMIYTDKTNKTKPAVKKKWVKNLI